MTMLILYDGDEDVVDDNDDIDDDGSVRKQTRFHYFVDVAAAILDKQLSNERRLCSKTITDSPHVIIIIVIMIILHYFG